ncbi:PAS domain S-box protein [Hymenobacter sp. 15J16-1T3B]|uniref:PAS domain-containing hybrid sensor histidine kinase/response regulator n=1 Tax=Hymenobacter sp. 15J16-1T3B TaxID=2886941 RepID=UPI001D102E61|nr:PAS domain S-box protein [Hymenobacter sp. 15J16-1T3B]MCC3156617.1 PAS domain S-box protein [Hymenobacter sp. 15J16-1T3B]
MRSESARLSRHQLVRVRRWAQDRHARQQAEQQLAAAQAQLEALQQQVEQQRTATAAQLSLLLQTLPTAVLAETPTRQVALANQLLCDLLGLPDPPAALLGQHTAAVLARASNPPADAAAFAAWAERAIADPARAEQQSFDLRDGRVLQGHYLPLHQGPAVALHLWNYEDVTRQHHAQRRIQQLSELSEQSPNPILTADLQGELRYANAAAGPVRAALADPANQETAAFLRRHIAEAIAEQRPRTTEYPLDGHFYIWTVVPLPAQGAANVYLTDISVRRRAEAELRRSQLLLARINDTLPTLVFLYDMLQRRLLYCNDQSEVVLGYAPTELQRLAPGAMRMLMHPDDVPTLLGIFGRYSTLVDGGLLEAEVRMLHRDGSWRWLLIKITVFDRDDMGRVRQVVGSAEDVTERRRATEELARSRHFLARVSDTVPNIIYLYDLQEGRNLYCNQQVVGVLGYSEGDLQAMGPGMFGHLVLPEDQPVLQAHRNALRQAGDGVLLTTEYRLRHRNGAVLWLRVRESVFARDAAGRPREIIGSGEDVTQQKHDEDERQRARARTAEQSRLVRQVIDSVPHLVYLKDADGRYVLANQATADLFGRTVEDLIGRTIEDLHENPDTVARYHAQDQQVIQTGTQLAVEEIFLRADGEVLCFHSIKRPFVQSDGEVLVLGVDSNITELKRVQQALRSAKDAAEENARVKQEFLANMSHEVRTPLNGILGMAGLLAQSPLDTTQAHYLALIRQSADHLLVVINDVLSAAQLGAGKLRLEYIPFDLHALLRDMLDSQQLRAAEKQIGLRLELPAAPPALVLGDPHRLRQIVLNLLGNAIKFTAQGQVTLRGHWVADGPEAATFHLAVQDTGIGIAPHQLALIFEPFTQASASTAREFGGSGLGLSISRGLVELLGGHIWAESTPGQGSTFHVELPLPPAQQPAAAAPAAPPAAGSLPPCRVLLAEDNAVNQLLAATLLRRWGATVDTAVNGLQALDLFERQRYDVVLMDIQMPGMDGVTAARHMLAHPDAARARTPIVALTAHALPGEAARCRQAGFVSYISKPFQEAKLLATLQQLVAQPESAPPTPYAESAEAPPAVAEPAAPLDLAPLRRLAADDPGFLRHMVGLFARTTPPVLAQMRQHCAAQNWPALADNAHFLKSSVGGLGLNGLLPALRELETAGHAGAPAPDRLRQLTEQVCTALERVMEQLGREYPGS